MVLSSLVRMKCYALLDGLERSLAENIMRHFDIREPNFFSDDERQKALKRLRRR